MIKKYLLYLFRWQLSTPILAVVLWWLSSYGELTATIVANLIGGLIFFWVDKFIFRANYTHPLWEIKENVNCSDCGDICQGYRLVKTKNYDRINDPIPEFRCTNCSKIKTAKLKKAGVTL